VAPASSCRGTTRRPRQSINEELQTVNHELKAKFEELSKAHSDLENLMAATDVATLFLDRNLLITRFTPSLAEIFNVKSRDRARPTQDLTHTLEADARRVLDHPVPLEVISTADERSRRALAIMKRQVGHATRLLNDLLDIARINRGLLRVHREVVNLDQCLRRRGARR
jgi:signal transduction histidine kinase